MKKAVPYVLFLYIIALHTSIAGMEIFGWLLVLGTGLFFSRPSITFFKRYWFMCTLLGLLLGWVAISLYATPLEKPFLQQWGFLRWTVLLPCLAVIISQLWDKEFEKNLLNVWMFAAGVVALYGVFQFFTGIDLIRPGRGLVNPQAGGIYKAVGFFSMSLTYVYVFGQSAFGVGFAIFKERGQRVGLFIAGLFGLAIIAGMSRGAWVAGICTLGLYLLLEKRKWLLPYFVAVVIAVFGASRLHDAIGSKITNMATGHVDHSSSVRIDLWRAYLRMFLDHPFAGVGIFEGDKLLPEYFQRLGIEQPFTSHAHNNILQWLAGTGVFGFLIFSAFSLLLMRMSWQVRAASVLGYGLLFSQVFWKIGGLTECNFFDGEVNHFIIFIWALAWGLHFRGEYDSRTINS